MSQYFVRLTFFLGHVRCVRSLRKNIPRLVLLASCIVFCAVVGLVGKLAGAILRCVSGFFGYAQNDREGNFWVYSCSIVGVARFFTALCFVLNDGVWLAG